VVCLAESKASAAVANEIRLEIVPYTEGGAGRRFRWVLKAAGEQDLTSTLGFATEREALKQGEVALERAKLKKRLR
jgi:hypothetical protein